jgi:outer membrane protein TolC
MPPSLFGDTGLGDENVFPIDLPTALQLAGANNLQIAIARERVNQAGARAQLAGALWIPSLNAGVVYNNHSGRIQGTEGEVVEASRSSFFVGGAAVVGNSPATGSGGNPRMFVDLSLADALFEPLAARQLVRATSADRTTAFNDTLFEVSAAYLTLVRAQARLAITQEAVRNAEELAKITRDFAETGQGLQADADRATVEAAARRRDVLQAEEELAVISAHLARLLRLDPAVQLQPAEQIPAPLEFVDPSLALPSLIGQAAAARPEVRTADAIRDAACYRQRQEQVRPWVPHLYAGASGGGFGGGEGSDVDNFGGRSDFDVAAVWELQNLGFGNVARRREQQSVYRQANLAIQQVRDLVAAEVAQAYQRVQLRRRQIEVTRPQVESAHQAIRLNFEGIRGGELRPIEIQQAIGALASSRTGYLDAVTDYNVAQVQLLRAIGQPPSTTP